jgi:hypothetical protein
VLHNLLALALRMVLHFSIRFNRTFGCFVLGVSSDCSLSFCPSEYPGMAFSTLPVD